MASIKNWKSPVLLIHGDDDRNVAFNQSVLLMEALRAQGIEFEELIFPDEVHDFLSIRALDHVDEGHGRIFRPQAASVNHRRSESAQIEPLPQVRADVLRQQGV